MWLGSAARALTSLLRSRFLIQFVLNLESLYGELWVSPTWMGKALPGEIGE
ncbi:hypothetical protein X733_08325 [Mesorhizobium sp. L2C067A000]|nr:hypothetical protein X733_08325 [Mesorhizobium sp. L2C067A000]